MKGALRDRVNGALTTGSAANPHALTYRFSWFSSVSISSAVVMMRAEAE